MVIKKENHNEYSIKRLKNVLPCSGIILKRTDTSEEWQAKVSDIDDYGSMYVTKLSYSNIIIDLQKEPIEH